jgi:hypothetical protein
MGMFVGEEATSSYPPIYNGDDSSIIQIGGDD